MVTGKIAAMHELVKSIFTGKWKSFKIFKRSGDVRLSSRERFVQFEFEADARLTISTYENGGVADTATADRWNVELKGKRHYMQIPQLKTVYEVITVNHTVMVLADTVTGEKTFFARDHNWEAYLKANEKIII